LLNILCAFQPIDLFVNSQVVDCLSLLLKLKVGGLFSPNVLSLQNFIDQLSKVLGNEKTTLQSKQRILKFVNGLIILKQKVILSEKKQMLTNDDDMILFIRMLNPIIEIASKIQVNFDEEIELITEATALMGLITRVKESAKENVVKKKEDCLKIK
jgi:hypothetical protein